MAVSEQDFSNYELGTNPLELAGGLLPEIARASQYELSDTPSEESLQGFVGHIGPAKWLQDNIGLVQERLGSQSDSTTIAADWVDRSGALLVVHRSFSTPEIAPPKHIDAAFITGGVARWMLRRAQRLATVSANEGHSFGQVFIPVGNREMKDSEHDLVAQLAAERGRTPTEHDFAKGPIADLLQAAGLRVEIIELDEQNGDTIMDTFVAQTDVTEGSVLAVGNAPSAIQTAGQFRWAARKTGNFDDNGAQLFMTADEISVARHGEPAATHQNPYTALGQLARNALYLVRNA